MPSSRRASRDCGKHFYHSAEVGDLLLCVAGASLQQTIVVERAGVVRIDRKRFADRRARRFVLLPDNLGESNVGVAVDIIVAQLDHFSEGSDGLRILELIEQRDAEIIPAHPVGIVGRVRRLGLVFSDLEDARARSDFDHRIGRMIFAKDVIEIALAQMPIIHLCGHSNGASNVCRKPELIAH